jgi:hypothetical protein
MGDWLLKASSFDDQILILGYNHSNVDYFFRMFYDEESAHSFVEKLNDKNFKVSYR